MSHRFQFHVVFGHCDEAGIVFYPNYFHWFDGTFADWCRTKGMSQRSLRARFGIHGTPIVDTGATFHAPATYDDLLTIEAEVSEWREKSFRVAYRVTRDQLLIAEGFEARVWVVRGANGKLSARPIAPEFKEALA